MAMAQSPSFSGLNHTCSLVSAKNLRIDKPRTHQAGLESTALTSELLISRLGLVHSLITQIHGGMSGAAEHCPHGKMTTDLQRLTTGYLPSIMSDRSRPVQHTYAGPFMPIQIL